jgi:ferric-dicitrate binding protein FerR (iron transport regulator)
MKCRVSQRRVYLLCDGLLPGDESAALEAHIAKCNRCASLLREARLSLAVLRSVRTEPAPTDEASADAAIARGFEAAGRQPRMLEFPHVQKQRWLAAAATVVLFAAAFSAYFCLHGVNREGFRSAGMKSGPQGSIMCTLARDTTVIFNRMCGLRICANSRVTLNQPSPRVVHFDLAAGGVRIAAHKGLYDTISVRCGAVSVMATGTHFAVDRGGDEIRVAVVEGTVVVRNGQTGSRSAVACGELCVANGESGTMSTGPMPQSLRSQLAEGFETLGPWDFPLGLSRGQWPQTRSAHAQEDGSAAQRTFAAIRHTIRRAEYDSAIVALVNYLARYSVDKDVAWCDLALCYSKTSRWESALDAYKHTMSATSDTLVQEAVLHRSNSILFSKLARFKDAEKGIRDYLAAYPIGAWREREYGMLVKIELAEKRRDDAAQTIEAYQSEFPASCSVEEMRMEIANLSRDSDVKGDAGRGR